MGSQKARTNNLNVLKCLLIALLVLLFAGVTLAQQETGQITGTINDQSGAVIPGAKVSTRSLATSAERSTTSSDSGNYAITNLLPGDYEVTVEAKGFTNAKRRVTVAVGARVALDFSLNVGTATTTVEVTGEMAEQVNTETQTLSDVITTKQILQLPSLTRNPYDFVAIGGNVAPDTASGRGVGFSINGQRSASTNVLLDGADNNDTFTAVVGQGVPLDSVQEFSVVTSSFTAEYGRASGGVVNVATKSGTNAFHGTAYEFNRVSKLASNGFDNNARGVPRGIFTRNQFGYSIGGPVIKDKLFFFSNTEWFRIRSGTELVALVPTPQLLAAASPNTRAFFSAFGALKPGTTLGQVFTKNDISGLCNATGPCANLPGSTPVWQTVNYPVPTDAGGGSPRNETQTVNRIDYNLSDRTTIYGRYALQKQDFFVGTNGNSPFQGFDTGEQVTNNNMLLSMTHTFSPRLVSQSKIVFNRLNDLQPLGTAAVGPTLYLSSANTASRILGTRVALPGYLPYSPGSAIPFGGPQNLAQLFEDISYTRGKHQLRFGGSYVYLRDNRAFGAYQEAVEQLGSSLKQGMDNFLNGSLRTFQAAIDPQGKFPGDKVTLPVGPPDFTRSNRYSDFAFYGQDSWRVKPRLTLNLGLRWEYFGVQHNKHPEKDSNFFLGPGADLNHQVNTGKVLTVPNSPIGGLWNKDLNNFAPRVGIAWDVFGNGKTSLRGGYGISYERNFGNVTFNVIQNPPNYAVISITPADVGGSLPVTVNNAGPLAGSTGSKVIPPVTLRAVNENIKTAYAHFWSVAVEHEVAGGTVVSLEYSGSKGVGLYSIDRVNTNGSGAVFLGLSDPNSVLNPQYGSINYRTDDGFSNYHAMVASVKSRDLFHAGLQLQFNYTWSHAIDNISTTFSESGNDFNLGVLDPTNPKLDKGNADFDNRHRVAFSAVFAPKVFRGSSGVVKQVLNGWSFTPIITAQTGNPFTVFDCTNGFFYCNRMLIAGGGLQTTGSGSPTAVTGVPNQFNFIDLTSQLGGTGDNAFFNPITGTADFGPFPKSMSGRNIFRAPGTWNMNLGIYKDFKFKNERFGLQFRGELYNLFNHANLFADTGSADISSVTSVTAFRDGRRNVQLAIKFIF
jgi:Carboxypeptidase regulatory-like domain/TonB-dependent Receptor Plug Domain/TonB dependent receptor